MRILPSVDGERGRPMDYDEDKIDEVILALLGAFEFEGGRAWKRFDFDSMDRLHASGMISEPKGRAESVYLTEDGMARARALAAKYFGNGPGNER